MAIKIVRFKDGLDVISECTEISKDVLVLENPMMFEIRGVNLQLQHWLPIAVMKQDYVEVNLDNVLCTMNPNDDFEEYYLNTLMKLQEDMKKEREVLLTDEILSAFEEKGYNKSLIH